MIRGSLNAPWIAFCGGGATGGAEFCLYPSYSTHSQCVVSRTQIFMGNFIARSDGQIAVPDHEAQLPATLAFRRLTFGTWRKAATLSVLHIHDDPGRVGQFDDAVAPGVAEAEDPGDVAFEIAGLHELAQVGEVHGAVGLRDGGLPGFGVGLRLGHPHFERGAARHGDGVASGNHAGVLKGVITKAAAAKPEAK